MGLQQTLDRATRVKLVRCRKFPNADLAACLHNMAGRGFRPTHIFDIGANMAKWSSVAVRVFPDCTYTLVEPQEEVRPHLERFCRTHPKARWVQAGAADTVGEMTFTVNPDTVSSTFVISADEAARRGFEQRTVPVVTLDHLVEENGGHVPELVKIDAEGFEQPVLRGATTLIGTTEAFLLETQFFSDPPHESGIVELVRVMSDYGYTPYDFAWFGRRPYDGAISLVDVMFVRRDSPLRSHKAWV